MKYRRFWVIVATLAGLSAVSSVPATPPESPKRIGASGHIEPNGGVISIAGTIGAIVRKIHVTPGAKVLAGSPLVTLGGEPMEGQVLRTQAEFDAATESGPAEVQAHRLAVEAAQVRLTEASRQVGSYQTLGARSASSGELAQLKAAEKTAELALRKAQIELRAKEIEIAHRIDSARQALQMARDTLILRAPVDATVLRLDAGVGQQIGEAPVLHLGDLSQMWVVADIYEGDVPRLREGLRATIHHSALASDLKGIVDGVGHLIDPRSRLAQVKIRLSDGEPVRQLVGLEVEVTIERD
jgi:HlyD family secretion protein